MKIKQITSYLSASAIALTTTLVTNTPTLAQEPTFFCGVQNGSPATIVQSSKYGEIPLIIWNSSAFESAGYDNQTRCNMVSDKFQTFSSQGTLNFFTTGIVGKYPVVCAVESQDAPCNKDSLLFTLKKEADSTATLKNLFDVRAGATNQALEETESRLYLNFEDLLADKVQEKEETPLKPASSKPEPAENTNEPLF